MIDGAVRMGMPYDVASVAAAKVMEGTARMVLETGEHPAALKSKVYSWWYYNWWLVDHGRSWIKKCYC